MWTSTSGTGPPLMLCHGGPGLWDDLEPVAEMVGDLVAVHRWDQRGCGRSTGSGPYTLTRFIADLEELRLHFGYERWLVGGHSWGATLALLYSFACTERVSSLLYISGVGVGSEWKASYRVEHRLTPGQRRRRDELKVRCRNEAEEREYRTLSWAPDHADRGRAFEIAASQAAAPFRVNYECNTALNAEIDAWREEDLLARCCTLDVPALIVHGSGDPRPAWTVDSMAKALPAARVHVIPDAGHVPWLEAPGNFAAILRSFLQGGLLG